MDDTIIAMVQEETKTSVTDVMGLIMGNKTHEDFTQELLKQKEHCTPEALKLLETYLLFRDDEDAPNTFLSCYKCNGCCHTSHMCKNTRATVMAWNAHKKPCDNCGGKGHNEAMCGIVLNKDCPKWKAKNETSE